jgi:hypothetical protein
MTDIIELAKRAGLTDPDLGDWMTDYGNAEGAIRDFARLVAEECANMADEQQKLEDPYAGFHIAAAIRAKFCKKVLNGKGE